MLSIHVSHSVLILNFSIFENNLSTDQNLDTSALAASRYVVVSVT